MSVTNASNFFAIGANMRSMKLASNKLGREGNLVKSLHGGP